MTQAPVTGVIVPDHSSSQCFVFHVKAVWFLQVSFFHVIYIYFSLFL